MRACGVAVNCPRGPKLENLDFCQIKPLRRLNLTRKNERWCTKIMRNDAKKFYAKPARLRSRCELPREVKNQKIHIFVR